MNTRYKEQAEFLEKRFQEIAWVYFSEVKARLYEIEHRFVDESLRGVPIEDLFKGLQRELNNTDEKLRYINKRLYHLVISSDKQKNPS